MRIAIKGFIALSGCTVLMAGCGGGGGGGASPAGNGGGSVAVTPSFALGGVVRGLDRGAQVTLGTDAGQQLVVAADGDFVFGQQIRSGSAYQVSVVSNPPGQQCAIIGGSGQLGSAVNDIQVTCNPASLAGDTDGPLVTTFAGQSGVPGVNDTREGVTASLFCPFGIATAPSGNLYVTDSKAGTVRKIDAAGSVSTFAGVPVLNLTDGPRALPVFQSALGIARDPSGNLYVGDGPSEPLRKVAPDGSVSSVAGFGPGLPADAGMTAIGMPTGGVADAAGNVYFADYQSLTVWRTTPAGATDLIAGAPYTEGTADGPGLFARFKSPFGIALATDGALFVSDMGSHTIRRISPSGEVSTVAGKTGEAGLVDGSLSSARFNYPAGLAFDPAGNLYVADSGNRVVRMISPSGIVGTVAGSPRAPGGASGYGHDAGFVDPLGIAADGNGNLYVGDCGDHTVRKIALHSRAGPATITPPPARLPETGVVTTFAGANGLSGYVDGAASAARLVGGQIAVSAEGDIYLADRFPNLAVRKITASGQVTTIAIDATSRMAGQIQAPRFDFVGASGSIVVRPGGDLVLLDRGELKTVRQDGSTSTLKPAPNPSAKVIEYLALAPDGSLVTLIGFNQAWKLAADGQLTLLAGTSMHPLQVPYLDGGAATTVFDVLQGVVVDSAGNTFVADGSNKTVRKISPGGVVTAFAGNPAMNGFADGTGTGAMFQYPAALAIDGRDNLYLVDANTVRKITPAGLVTTLAGMPNSSTSRDGVGAVARFTSLESLAVTRDGTVYVVDNGAIRKIEQH